MSAPPPLLRVRGLCVAYPGPDGRETAALAGVDLEVAPAEAVAVLGASGGGKSSLLLALAGLLPAGSRAAGLVEFRGEPLLGAPERRWRALRGAHIASLFQEPAEALNPVLRAGAHVSEVLRAHGRPRAAADVAAAFRDVGLDPALAARFPHELSGGQRQRVALAQAVAARPALLLADEPTSALDPLAEADVLALLRGLRARHGMALLLVTHALWTAAAIADRVVVLDGGRTAEEGTAAALLAGPRHAATRRLVDAARLEAPPAG